MVLDASLLNTQHYRVQNKGKVEQTREGVALSPTPWCSSYRKGSLRVTLDYGRQLLLFIYCHPQTDCFVRSQLLSEARHVGRLKPVQLYARLCIIPLSQQANHVNSGMIIHYVVAFVCLHFCFTGYQGAQYIRKALHIFVKKKKKQKKKSKRMASNWRRKEAEDTPQQQLPTPTTPMT